MSQPTRPADRTRTGRNGKSGPAHTDADREPSRVPPHDLDAEIGLLGAALVDADVAGPALDTLTPDSFYKPAHGHIYTAIQALRSRGDELTPVILTHELHRTGLLETIGGQQAITKLFDTRETPEAAPGLAAIINEHHQLRLAIGYGGELAEAAYNGKAEDVASLLAAPPEMGSNTGGGGSSWAPVELADALTGEKARPQPTILTRSDGRALFYEGQVNYLHGADASGKSFIALFAAIEVISDGGHVVWVDVEDPDETTVIGRLLDLDITPDVITERFHYLHPDTEADPTAVSAVCDLIQQTGARLVVLDSVGELMGMEGVDEDRDAEVTPWMKRVFRPLADTGAAVLPVDHGVKNAGGKNGSDPLWASGSKRKRAQVTGAGFLVHAVRPLSKDVKGGHIQLTTAKDRHGNFTRGTVAADFDITIYPDDGWSIRIHPPSAGSVDEDRNLIPVARAAVKAAKKLKEDTHQAPSMKLLEESMKVKASRDAKRAGIELAVAHGALREDQGPRKARVFHFVKELKVPND